MCIPIYIYIYINSLSLYTYMYIYIYICVYALYIYIYIYTYVQKSEKAEVLPRGVKGCFVVPPTDAGVLAAVLSRSHSGAVSVGFIKYNNTLLNVKTMR